MKKLIVVREGGFLTSINPKDKKITDTIVSEVDVKDVEPIIHGYKKR